MSCPFGFRCISFHFRRLEFCLLCKPIPPMRRTSGCSDLNECPDTECKLSLSVSVCLSLCLSVSVSLSLSVCLSVSLSLSLSLSLVGYLGRGALATRDISFGNSFHCSGSVRNPRAGSTANAESKVHFPELSAFL